ncbi:cyclic nucleotide-binding domain protein (macronuclear) [Tetrahymena thermophila SB210]|uniref:Cyclic nucleotide-binding domain protein n=1 Tax=Tetrahymena thermophila (strain SB210) TaxID=312017 RepID=I7M798_TETTS|nr:cyclic nucleotide-binding domain protein [Tetrahymena thermophila SB210]EAR90824.2 cyclic nucleotide-binding domain protein [Tetrahymena thermophila SB210]|eukprot:XP_001011069.2 cyclic nucleotide-binding domain protein [Tetrahymena thermophila SB210]
MSNYLQRTKLIQLMAIPFNQRSQQEIKDLEYYMKCFNPNLGQLEDEEKVNIYKEVCKYMKIECFKQDDIVYQHGTEGDKFYLLLEGEIDGYLPDNQEKELVLVNQIKISESFGQKSLIYKQPRLRTMIAQKDSVCGVLLANEFLQILKKSFSLQETQQINFLWELPYFNKLDFKQVKRLHSACTFEIITQNQQVFREDIDMVTSFYIVKSGDFAIYKKLKSKQGIEQDSQFNESQQEQQMMKSQKLINKKIYSLNQCEFFGLNDIIKSNTKRSYSVQCLSKQGEIFVLSKDLFYLIVMDNPESASYIQIINKKQTTNLENLISNLQVNQSIDSSTSTPNQTPLQDGQDSPSQDFTPINISQFYKQSQRFSEKIQIKYDENHQIILSKNTIDSLHSSQNGDELNDSLKQQQGELKYTPFTRKNRKKQITIQPQNSYSNKNMLEVLANKEDRRKSYSPNEITKDLIDQLYNLNKKSQNMRSSLTQIPQNILSSPKNALNISEDARKIKSFVHLPQDDQKLQRSDISYGEIENNPKKLSENIQYSFTNLSDKKIETSKEILLPQKQLLGLQNNELYADIHSQQKNQQIFNHLTERNDKIISVGKTSIGECGEQQNQNKIQENHIITISIPGNKNDTTQILNEQTSANLSQIQEKQNTQNKSLPQILINQIQKEQIPQQQILEVGQPTLRHLEEEDLLLQNFKQNLNKQNAFISCYSYLPSISTYFMKKKENPIDLMTLAHHTKTQISANPRIQQIDIQKHQLNRKLKQGLNKSQEDISLINQSNDDRLMTSQIAQNQSQEIIQSKMNKLTNNPNHNQNQETQYLPQVVKPNLQNTEYPFQSSYYHNSRPRMNANSLHYQTNYQNRSQNNSQSFTTKNNNYNSQTRFQSQNNLQSQTSFEKKSPLAIPRSTSQELQTKVSQSPIKSMQAEKEYLKKMSKPSFLLGEKPKKEVIGVFNADFFTSLKGKFIKQFTYNPQIFKDIQRYKFEDFLKKHLHDGPLSDYLKNKGTVDSYNQKKKDLEDFKRQKKIVEDIATNAIESLKYFHRQQMRKSQGLLSTNHQDQKPNIFMSNNSKLNSLSLQYPQQNLNKSQSPLRKSAENINFQNSPLKQQLNIQRKSIPNQNMHRHTRSQQDLITSNQNNGFYNIQQGTQSPITLNKNINNRKKKTQLNFMLGNHGIQNQNKPIRLHSLTNQHKGSRQSFQFNNQSQL